MQELHIVTHLQDKTNQEVECSYSDEQHFKVHIRDVVQLKKPAEERPWIQHQPDHDTKVDEQQTKEDHWKDEKRVASEASIFDSFPYNVRLNKNDKEQSVKKEKKH